MGSPTFPISATGWYTFWRPVYNYKGLKYISVTGDPLFIHQVFILNLVLNLI